MEVTEAAWSSQCQQGAGAGLDPEPSEIMLFPCVMLLPRTKFKIPNWGSRNRNNYNIPS